MEESKMTNIAQGTAAYHLLYQTDMNMEEFLHKFHEENIIDQKVMVTLSDGSVHTFHVYEYIKGIISSFIVDDEETIDDEIDMKNVINLKEKVTKLDSVTKIAL
jgi:hypothetical protein